MKIPTLFFSGLLLYVGLLMVMFESVWFKDLMQSAYDNISKWEIAAACLLIGSLGLLGAVFMRKIK